MDFKALLKDALGSPTESPLAKATFLESSSATTGLTYYDLEAPAKMLYPVLTPLRNETPRVSGKGGIQANWKAVTAINPSKVGIGVPEGTRGGTMDITTADYLAAYRGIGLESSASFEAVYAGRPFADIQAEATQKLLQAMMIREELALLGGNTSVSLGTAPQPTLSASGSGSSLAASALSVICVALTLDGYYRASIAGGVQSKITVSNPNGKTYTQSGGCSKPSTAASVTPSAGNYVYGSVTPVNGAIAYAWYWGAAGNEALGAITTINSVSIGAAAAGTQLASALDTSGDWSIDGMIFDGLLYQVFKPGLNGYVNTLATGTAGTGTKLTPNNVGGVDEIDTALQHFWDNWRLSPAEILVSSQEQKSITNAILAGSSASAQRFNISVDQNALVGGFSVKEYLNPFGMNGSTAIPIKLHPNMPAGTIFFRSKELPYPMANVPNLVQVRARQEYYQLQWPLQEREYQYGVYADEVLQNYFPAAFGVITNIAKG